MRGRRAGHSIAQMRVSINAIGYVAETTPQALQEFFPAYETVFGALGRKAGWPAFTRERFAYLTAPGAALVVGSPADVVAKLQHMDEVLGGLARVNLQMSVGPVPLAQRLRTIELLGTAVAPHLR